MTIAGRTYKALQEEVLSFQFSEKYRELTKRWLNDAQRKAVIQSEFRTQQETEAFILLTGENTHKLPEDYGSLIGLFLSGEELGKLDFNEFATLEAFSGEPSIFSVFGETVGVYPTPDAKYILGFYYWRLPQDMAADGDEPEIPAQYHELLCAYAMMKAYARENDYQASRFWKEEWEAGVTKMRGEVQHDTFQGPQQVSGMWNRGVNYVASSVWR